ncbi:hypothetical protein EJB05_53418, partial [Eragrostis curvula]
MGKGGAETMCIAGCSIVSLLTLISVLLVAYSDFSPVEVTVEEATLGRLSLAAPAGYGAPAFLSYNLSLAVAVRNPNWAIRVWRTVPLDAAILLGRSPFALVRLAGAEERELIRPMGSAVYRAEAVAESVPVALGWDGVAEFDSWKRVAGLIRLELVVPGEVKYQAHSPGRAASR